MYYVHSMYVCMSDVCVMYVCMVYVCMYIAQLLSHSTKYPKEESY